MDIDIGYLGVGIVCTKSPFLQRVANLLPGLPTAGESLAKLSLRSSSIEKGKEILTTGWAGRQLVTVAEGVAMRYRLLPDGGRQIIMFLLPGDVCTAHLYPSILDHSVAAVTAVRTERIDCSAMLQLLQKVPELHEAFWILAEKQNAIMRDHITSLGRGDARYRIATMLVELAGRMQTPGAVGRAIVVPITQTLLADSVGVTHIHFNRLIGEFSRRGIVSTTRGSLIINNIALLQQALNEISSAA